MAKKIVLALVVLMMFNLCSCSLIQEGQNDCACNQTKDCNLTIFSTMPKVIINQLFLIDIFDSRIFISYLNQLNLWCRSNLLNNPKTNSQLSYKQLTDNLLDANERLYKDTTKQCEKPALEFDLGLYKKTGSKNFQMSGSKIYSVKQCDNVFYVFSAESNQPFGCWKLIIYDSRGIQHDRIVKNLINENQFNAEMNFFDFPLGDAEIICTINPKGYNSITKKYVVKIE